MLFGIWDLISNCAWKQTQTECGTGNWTMKEVAVSRFKFVKPSPKRALTSDDYFKLVTGSASSFTMGCTLNKKSSVVEAGGIGCTSISSVGTNFRWFPADLYWMCLGGYGDSLWTICSGWRNSVSGVWERYYEHIRTLQNNKACFRKHKVMNKTVDRVHVWISVENISYLTRFERGNDFTAYEMVWHCQLWIRMWKT